MNQQLLNSRSTLTLAAAKAIADAAEAQARAEGWNVVVAIVDDGGDLIYLQRMDGTQLASIDIAIAKAVSAVRFKRPTKAFEDALVGGRLAVLKLPKAMPVDGGLPVLVEGQIVGGIGVSGVQPDQDGKVARAGLATLE